MVSFERIYFRDLSAWLSKASTDDDPVGNPGALDHGLGCHTIQFCWRVRENEADARAVTQWGELATFLQKHEAQPQDLTLSRRNIVLSAIKFYCQLTQREYV